MICPSCGHDNLPGAEECAECQQDLTHLDLPMPSNRIEEVLMTEPVRVLGPATPVSVPPGTTLAEAIQTMIDRNVGALLVVNDKRELVGILSERDILMKVIGKHQHYDALPVEEVMTPNPECVKDSDTLAFALGLMDAGRYRHLPVVREGVPIGVISVRDMLRHLCSLAERAGSFSFGATQP